MDRLKYFLIGLLIIVPSFLLYCQNYTVKSFDCVDVVGVGQSYIQAGTQMGEGRLENLPNRFFKLDKIGREGFHYLTISVDSIVGESCLFISFPLSSPRLLVSELIQSLSDSLSISYSIKVDTFKAVEFSNEENLYNLNEGMVNCLYGGTDRGILGPTPVFLRMVEDRKLNFRVINSVIEALHQNFTPATLEWISKEYALVKREVKYNVLHARFFKNSCRQE
ncbi:hypothetical protein [Lewinella sp. W8]|uniref:hypothetical protein n=1 Tax=Lewinella sp. W8 TaxID=2528208 RepID=UPI00106776BA|nr:hypothetical protein [Lewinella sp. W8]MTB50328.1 hypothetical protein [Lewinella sp. W8]